MGRCTKGHRKPRKLPYGATRGKYWCGRCDADLVPEWRTKPSTLKKKERIKAKKFIKEQL